MKPRWIICDIDGTLSDAGWRASMLPDWDAFHEASINDNPFADTVALLEALHSDTNIAIVTGRNEKYRGLTNQWLIKNRVRYHAIYMRADDDFSKAADFKLGVFRRHFSNSEVWLVLEDDEKVVEAFRDVGLTCHQVRAGIIS